MRGTAFPVTALPDHHLMAEHEEDNQNKNDDHENRDEIRTHFEILPLTS
jgi:hypothetical protein